MSKAAQCRCVPCDRVSRLFLPKLDAAVWVALLVDNLQTEQSRAASVPESRKAVLAVNYSKVSYKHEAVRLYTVDGTAPL